MSIQFAAKNGIWHTGCFRNVLNPVSTECETNDGTRAISQSIHGIQPPSGKNCRTWRRCHTKNGNSRKDECHKRLQAFVTDAIDDFEVRRSGLWATLSGGNRVWGAKPPSHKLYLFNSFNLIIADSQRGRPKKPPWTMGNATGDRAMAENRFSAIRSIRSKVARKAATQSPNSEIPKSANPENSSYFDYSLFECED